MEILKLFIYILTGAWFIYFVLGMGYIIYLTKKVQIAWEGIFISSILLSASLAFYFGG